MTGYRKQSTSRSRSSSVEAQAGSSESNIHGMSFTHAVERGLKLVEQVIVLGEQMPAASRKAVGLSPARGGQHQKGGGEVSEPLIMPEGKADEDAFFSKLRVTQHAFAKVVLGWGYEDGEISFFYDAMISELASRGLVEWFKEESERGQS